MIEQTASPIELALRELVAIDPKWQVDLGLPDGESGWIAGDDLRRADDGPFQALLMRIAARLKTGDRKTVAASFALRFGWAASAAIGPFLTHRCVPDVTLDNVWLKFRDDTLFERTAIATASGFVTGDPAAASGHPLVRGVGDAAALLATLRHVLVQQAAPVVEALHAWSGFARRGTWGMIGSSWASQFINVSDRLGSQTAAMPVLAAFFPGTDDTARMQPRLHRVTLDAVTHVYQRRASCCRYYLLPQGSLCASCPLVSDEERLARNQAWMRRILSPPASGG